VLNRGREVFRPDAGYSELARDATLWQVALSMAALEEYEASLRPNDVAELSPSLLYVLGRWDERTKTDRESLLRRARRECMEPLGAEGFGPRGGHD
jgi:hypothetical protein